MANIKGLSNLLNKSLIEQNGRFYIENNELVLELINGDFICYSDLSLEKEIRVIDCHKEIDRLKKDREKGVANPTSVTTSNEGETIEFDNGRYGNKGF